MTPLPVSAAPPRLPWNQATRSPYSSATSAEACERLLPPQGIDAAFDEAESAVDEAEDNLKAYLKDVKSEVSSSIKYASANKDTHLLEVPEDKASRVPRSWELKSNKKGFRRYMTQELQASTVDGLRRGSGGGGGGGGGLPRQQGSPYLHIVTRGKGLSCLDASLLMWLRCLVVSPRVPHVLLRPLLPSGKRQKSLWNWPFPVSCQASCGLAFSSVVTESSRGLN